MEEIFNYGHKLNDTNRVPDGRVRPQSAFIPSSSYYKSRDATEDDIGRPVRQHKPLAKGEHTQFSLAKVFEEDPGMRPKVFVPQVVNKVSYGLMSYDIDGGVPQMKAAPNRPRDTNPMAPQYILPGSSTLAAEAAAAAASAASAACPAASYGSTTHDGSFPTQASQPTSATGRSSPQELPAPSGRNTLDVSDINAVTSVSERPHKLETRGSRLGSADIEGSWPGWEPAFRAHVGRNLRDPGLDVSDISGSFSRGASSQRRAFSARPSVSRSRGGGASALGVSVSGNGSGRESSSGRESGRGSGTGHGEVPVAAAPPAPPAPASGSGSSVAATSASSHQPAPQGYLPPQVSWQPTYPEYLQQQHRHSQSQQQQQQQPQQPVVELAAAAVEPPQHAAGAWPTSISLPLRPTLGPPPFATHIPTGSVAVALAIGGSMSTPAAARTAAAADHPSTTVGKPPPGKRDARLRHQAKVAVADAQRAEAAEAQRLIASMRPSREAMEEFWASCRHLDRETCGKLTPSDFAHALQRSNLLAAAGLTADGAPGAGAGAGPEAAAVVLARGLQDGSGMVSYRYLARTLVGQTVAARRPLSAAVAPSTSTLRTAAAVVAPAPSVAAAPRPSPSPPPPAVAEAGSGSGLGPGSAAAGAPVPTGAESRPEQVVVGPAIRPSSRPPSRQASGGNGASASNSSSGGEARAGGPAGSGPGGFDSFSAAGAGAGAPDVAVGDGSWGADAAAAAPRRSVMWAPAPTIIEDATAPPQPGDITPSDQFQYPQPHHAHHHHQQQRQASHRSSHQHQHQHQQRDRPPTPSDPRASHSSPSHSHQRPQSASLSRGSSSGASRTATAVFHLGTTTASATSTAAGVPSGTPAASAAPLPGVGFGPGWPPQPSNDTLQKRDPDTIMQSESIQLRDVVDVTYFPFKAHPYWFGGRAPTAPDGGELPGGPGDAAREYLPSVDPLSTLVGKGQHRVNIPPTGQKLDPEVEAAIVGRLRPRTVLAPSPEATARAAVAASAVRQLQVDDPLQYPGAVDPTTPAGIALKGLLGALYPRQSGGAAAGHTSSSKSSGSKGHTATTAAGGTAGGGTAAGGFGIFSSSFAGSGAIRPSTAGPTRRSTHSRPASVSRSMSARVPGGGGAGGDVRVGRMALERQIHREEVAAVRGLC